MEFYNYKLKPAYLQKKYDLLSYLKIKKPNINNENNNDVKIMIKNIIMLSGIIYISKSTFFFINFIFCLFRRKYQTCKSLQNPQTFSVSNIVINLILLNKEKILQILNKFLIDLNNNKSTFKDYRVNIYIILDKKMSFDDYKNLDWISINDLDKNAVEKIDNDGFTFDSNLTKKNNDSQMIHDSSSNTNSIINFLIISIEKEVNFQNLNAMKNIDYLINYSTSQISNENSIFKYSAINNFIINKFISYKDKKEIYFLNEIQDSEDINLIIDKDKNYENSFNCILNDSKRISKNYYNKISIKEFDVKLCDVYNDIFNIIIKNLNKTK